MTLGIRHIATIAAVASLYSAAAPAQPSDEIPVLVTIDMSTAETPVCRVEAKDVGCSQVVEQLRAMGRCGCTLLRRNCALI